MLEEKAKFLMRTNCNYSRNVIATESTIKRFPRTVEDEAGRELSQWQKKNMRYKNRK